MSVAGILAGALFSGVGTQIAQQTPLSSFNTPSAPSTFAAVQQKLSESVSAAPPVTTSVPSELTQLGQDLKSGNLSAAQADYTALRMAIAQHHTRSSGNSGNITNPLAAAMLAYNSLQQNPNNVAQSTSLMTPASTFSIDA